MDDLQRVQRVDLVDVLLELISGFSLDFLDLFEATLLNERLLGGRVVWQGLGELVQHVVKDLSRAVFDQRFEGA